MHLQNIHGVNDKRALSEALSTSYAKSAANYYVAKTSAPVVPAKVESVSSVGQESKKDEVVVISSEKKEDLPMPRPDNKMLEALKLMPKITPSLEQPPVQYAHSRKRQFDIPGRKTLMPQDEDEGIGEMESDEHLKPLVLNMPLSLQATNLNTPFMYQRSVVYSSGKGRKDKYPKSPARGRPPKKGPESPGKLAALCEELAKRVESRQGKESPDDKEGTSEASVTCDICNKTFKHKNQLWGHKKTHSKIYTCRSGKDGRGTKTKSTRLGRRQNMPNFRDIANGKVPPLSEKMSVAIPEKKKPRNTLGSTKGTKQKHHLREPSAASAGVAVKEGNEADKKDKRLKKKKKKMAKRKRKALAKIITAYKENPQRKKKIFLKEGNNAFYPRRFFYRYCLLQRQERNRRMLAHLRQAVLLEIDADTKKNVYECLKCHRYHRFQSRCLQHYQDQHLSRKKQSQKLDATVPSKKGKEVPDTTKKVTSRVIDTKEDKKKGCHYCNTPVTNALFMKLKRKLLNDLKSKLMRMVKLLQLSCLSQNICIPECCITSLNTHQVNQTRDVPCPSCSFIAKSPLSLAAHSRVHKKSPNKDSSDLNRTAMQQQRPQVDSSKPKKVYNCDQCKSAFYNFNALRLHKTMHKDYFPYRCSQCPACFKKAEDMYDHIQQMHPTKNQFKCNKCTYSSSSYTTLLKHERGHDREENKMKALRSPLWKKDVAMPPPDTAPGSSGMNAGALDLRMTSSKDRPSPEKDENSETNVKISDKQSEIDDKVGPGKGTVNIEMVKGDEKKIENGEKKKEKVKVPTEAEIIESLSVKFNKVEVASGSDEGWFFCTECSFTTNVQDSYLRHFKMHERAEMLTCDECQFPVLDQQGLEEHMLKAHNKNVSKLSCDMCQYVTSVPERMVRHKRLHKKMTLQCDHCGYRTPEKRFMIRHILTVHEQQRPFNCEKCNYATAYKHHLKRHYRLHKQQILQCPKCVHCTLDEKLMLHHIQSHKTNTTNVKCDVCNREFVNSKSLAIHKSRDHGKQSLSVEDAINHMTPGRQYRCEISSVKTHQETPLQLHTVSAQEGVPEVYKCKQCPYKTTHQSSITLHMMQEHIEESDIQMKIKDLRDVKQCAQCGFCTTKDQLDAHMRSHLEKDVYTCDECNFKTSHFYALSRHTCIQEAGGSSEVMDKQEKIKSRNKESGPEANKQDEIQEVDNQEGKHGDSEMTKLDEVQELDQQGTSQGSQSTEEDDDDLKKSKADEVQETDEQGMIQEIVEDGNIQGEQQEQAIDLNKDTPPVDQMLQIKTEPGSIPTEVTKAPEVIQPSTKVKQSQENNNETPEPVLQQQPGAICQLCQKTYETENHLKNHVKIDHTHLVVNAQNPFVCVLCPYSSCSEKEARRHLGLHNYEQEFKCEFCVFSTATASSIATHRKVHRNNKRHSTLTSKRKNACLRVPATLIGNYASGILIDVGGVQKRRYPCKFCGDVFQVAEEWQHHERRHLMVWNMEHAAEASK
ncbi:LOW QUALITY PROTEIN: uncharacterized protein [Amphiura filiformis]|uniref:LOW QUALITY PROTEIN: uncharacterized protein n=1 Tax=Amphiura filiformis TaxID=82378 RepID=UPI003B21805A